MSATFHVPGGGAVWDFGPMSGVAHDAVDLLDVAARLESSGVSDRTAAQRHGRPDVFALAADIVRSQGALGALLCPVPQCWRGGALATSS
jgi:hypothetical protein